MTGGPPFQLQQGGSDGMTGTLSLSDLRDAISAGALDTVIVCFPDMIGRLVGKRFQAEFFAESAHEETHACDYLLANDIELEPVPGSAAASRSEERRVGKEC